MNTYVKWKRLASLHSSLALTMQQVKRQHIFLAGNFRENTKTLYVQAITFIRKPITFTIIRTAFIALEDKKKNVFEYMNAIST